MVEYPKMLYRAGVAGAYYVIVDGAPAEREALAGGYAPIGASTKRPAAKPPAFKPADAGEGLV